MTIPTVQPTYDEQLQIDKISAKIRTKLPGFFVLSSLARFHFTESIPTACTDGKNIWFGRKFWSKLSQAERAFVYLHEILHIAGKHHLRRGDRKPVLFNAACDYCINRAIVALLPKHSDWIAFPTGENAGLLDSQYDEQNEFDIYRLLDQSDSGQSDSGDSGDQDSGDQDSGDSGQSSCQQGAKPSQLEQAIALGGIGGVIDGNFESPEQRKAQEQLIDATVQRAAIVERMAHGNGSCNAIERIAQSQRKANRELASYLSQFIDNSEPSTGDWNRPDRRLMASGVYYASHRRESLETLTFAIDTSGSIGRETIERVSAVLADLFQKSTFGKLHVVYFNSAIYHVDTFTNGQKFALSPIRSGGTDFDDTFEYAEKSNSSALIMLTDGYACIPPKPARFKVCWVLTDDCNSDIGYGKQIKLGA